MTEANVNPASDVQQKPLIQVRPYHPEDREQVHKIFVAALTAHTETNGNKEFWLRYIDNGLKTDIGDIEGTYFASGGQFWVATTVVDQRELVIGTVGLEFKPDNEAELRRMFVTPEYQRSGAGRLLVNSLEEFAQQNEIVRVWLTTGLMMTRAQKFYQSLGFKHTKTTAVSPDHSLVQVCHYEKRYN
ncbi:hypothetical protein Poli38472_013030 [Pythium oligandrum]|uniref:N-acetyltransferase domain-containing protein n=1 Tax=Pythium oligandrum TaxID=41045 RepID=A0A8K1FN87_PYTOL|nr:hypothetical protein Poli38472_013030 [Pythium oligandrum]|eukprot:TMW64408.1 hypothetical protein Poli38472_013030 [Pythium oligandrum]